MSVYDKNYMPQMLQITRDFETERYSNCFWGIIKGTLMKGMAFDRSVSWGP